MSERLSVVLTPRVMETYKYLIAGLSNEEIAARMNITEPSVRMNLKAIYSSLSDILPGYFDPTSSQLSNRVKAVVLGLLNGVVEVKDFPNIDFIEMNAQGRPKPPGSKPLTNAEMCKRYYDNKVKWKRLSKPY